MNDRRTMLELTSSQLAEEILQAFEDFMFQNLSHLGDGRDIARAHEFWEFEKEVLLDGIVADFDDVLISREFKEDIANRFLLNLLIEENLTLWLKFKRNCARNLTLTTISFFLKR
ncbi:MAG: hypothetical protein AAB507_00390 [Patescibacteria group bacterium]